MLHVGVVTPHDPSGIWGWSVTLRYMCQALTDHGARVELIHGIPERRMSHKLLNRFGVRQKTAPARATLREGLARAVNRRLADSDCSVVLGALATGIVPLLETDRPIVHVSDATHRLLRNYYADRYHEEGADAETDEQQTIENAARLVYSSSWAAQSAIEHYGAEPARVHVVPFGANFDEIPGDGAVAAEPEEGPCRLLFVGQDWQRKGGQIAVDATAALNDMGIDAVLTVCGRGPSGKNALPASVRVLGQLDKSRSKERERLTQAFSQSHLFILPTRADCTPIVCSEACAFGLPILTTDTGGMADIVENGINGFRLPLASDGAQFASRIAEIWRNGQGYRALVASTRDTYRKRLNWNAWGARMVDIIEGIDPAST